jgi:hypothetical protein
VSVEKEKLLGLAEMGDMVRKNVDFGLKKKGCR